MLLGQRDVDAGIGRIDPPSEEQQRARAARIRVEIENQLVRLRDPLVALRRQVRDIAIVMLAQVREHVVTVLIDSGQRRPLVDDLEEAQTPGGGRESLVDKDVDRVGVIDREQPQLVEIGCFPELLGDLEDVAAIAWL